MIDCRAQKLVAFWPTKTDYELLTRGKSQSWSPWLTARRKGWARPRYGSARAKSSAHSSL